MEGFTVVEVRTVNVLTESVRRYELVPVEGALPRFEAGAHLNVVVEEGLVRSYSLCNDPAEADRYVIAVKREDGGRGGSRAMHAVRPGDRLRVSSPRNAFPLREDAPFSLLIAGGIGITPLLSMLRVLVRTGRDVVLHVLTRSREETPFLAELERPPLAGHVRFHHDRGVPGQGVDLGALLRHPPSGAQLYCCGPEGLMAAVRAHAAHWPGGALHFESFGGAAAPSDPAAAPFEVEVRSSGRILEVPAGTSLLHVLLENGVYVESDCEAGTCGTCALRVLEGTPDHRDNVLSEDDRAAGKMTACVSRARSARLVLDL